MDKRISWYSSPVGDKIGYGYAAVNLITAIIRQGVAVDYNAMNNKVHISFIQPEWYDGEPHQYRIGYTPWESTKLPDAWPELMNQRDEIWTTSNFCKRVFVQEGVTVPVRVVPHGVNPDHYPIMERQRGKRFNFLHIGGPTERKGGQKVFDAFIKLFEGQEDVHLIMKCNRHTEVRYFDKYERLHPAGEHPQCTVIIDEYDIDQMRELYRMAHCLVYPSNGEGFGFIPFQGIATGLPTIATAGTGMQEFASLSLPLEWTPVEGEGIHIGEWMHPDIKHLESQMKKAYEDWETEKEIALAGARFLHNTQTWDHIADKVLNMIGDKI